MTSRAIDASRARPSLHAAGAALKAVAGLWFLVAVAGQMLFVYYIVFLYGLPTVQGNLRPWNRNSQHPYRPGDTMGNLTFGIHVLLAIVMLAGGAIQLTPQIRRRAPSFHRWNGRLYLLTAFIMSIGGLYLVWIRGTVGDASQHVASTLNAVLIMLCAAMAFRSARARAFAVHRRWALRLFMVASGVWFFRVGIMLWLFINHGPAGFDPRTFTGPFLTFMTFAQYLLPLAVLELYLRTQERGGAPSRMAVAAGLFALTLAMGVGIFRATMVMWLPHIRSGDHAKTFTAIHP
jgi:hypothetical protein